MLKKKKLNSFGYFNAKTNETNHNAREYTLMNLTSIRVLTHSPNNHHRFIVKVYHVLRTYK